MGDRENTRASTERGAVEARNAFWAADAVFDRSADSLAVTNGRRPPEVRCVIGSPFGILDCTWMRCLSRSFVASQFSARSRFFSWNEEAVARGSVG